MIQCVGQGLVPRKLFRWEEVSAVLFLSCSYRLSIDSCRSHPPPHPASLRQHRYIRKEQSITGLFIATRGRVDNHLVWVKRVAKEGDQVMQHEVVGGQCGRFVSIRAGSVCSGCTRMSRACFDTSLMGKTSFQMEAVLDFSVPRVMTYLRLPLSITGSILSKRTILLFTWHCSSALLNSWYSMISFCVTSRA